MKILHYICILLLISRISGADFTVTNNVGGWQGNQPGPYAPANYFELC